MPALANPKHEQFAQLLARGAKQREAYVQAGYAPNPGAASKIANSTKVLERVNEIKGVISKQIVKAMEAPTEENWQTLADMGLTMPWVAAQFKMIYQEAMQAGQFPAANTAVDNIRKLIELERKGQPEEEQKKEDDRISVKDTLAMLREFKEILKVGGDVVPESVMVDITPRAEPVDVPGLLAHTKQEYQ